MFLLFSMRFRRSYSADGVSNPMCQNCKIQCISITVHVKDCADFVVHSVSPRLWFPTMLPVVSALLACLAAWFRSRHSMQLEILSLRHQLAVYQRSVPRPRIQPTDRLLQAWLARPGSGWQAALTFVQPRTVIAWQKKRFREHWRRLSQGGTSGRPTITKEVKDLIRDMSRANPTWGSPRVVAELQKLGIEVAKSVDSLTTTSGTRWRERACSQLIFYRGYGYSGTTRDYGHGAGCIGVR
jgi:hypothetical protein